MTIKFDSPVPLQEAVDWAVDAGFTHVYAREPQVSLDYLAGPLPKGPADFEDGTAMGRITLEVANGNVTGARVG